jgi:hypothetical protein
MTQVNTNIFECFFLPSVFVFSTLGKVVVCRVPDIMHSAKTRFLVVSVDQQLHVFVGPSVRTDVMLEFVSICSTIWTSTHFSV